MVRSCVITSMLFLLMSFACYSYAASPPMCPHVNQWNGTIGTWAQGAPWIKVMSKEDVVRAKGIAGAKVYYRPYDIPGTDQGWCTDGTAMANAVVANLNAIGQQYWPDAIGYRNEFNNDIETTPREFLEYYDVLRAAGYNGLIVFGSWAVWWPYMSDWADPDIQAAVNKADALEFHEYFDLTVACQQYILCHRHVEAIRQYPYLGYKPMFIGECGSDAVNCDDPQHRRGWNDRGKLTPEQYRDQLSIYRSGCAKQVVAAFIFQQGAVGDWWDFEILNTPLLTDWCRSTWTNLPGYATGYVRDTNGQPIADAVVTGLPAGINVKTNASGKYWLYNQTVGTSNITACKPGYANSSANVTINSNQTTTRDFTLTAASPGTLAGSVRDTSNNPLSGATVSTNVGGYSAVTDGNGNYTISNVGPGTYDLTASKSGFQTVTQTGKVVNSNQTTTVNFSLQSNFQGIQNGNMEGGSFNDPDPDHKTANYWHRFSLAGYSKSDVPYGGAHSGNYTQAIYESSWTAGIYQQITGATAGNSYTASVWVKGSDTNVKFWIGIDPTGGTDAASANVQWSSQYAPGSTWTQISKQATATSATITVFLKAQNTVALNKYAYFDDASIVDNGSGQPPTTGTLTGNVKDQAGANVSGATVTTNTGGYSATTDANGNYTISNVAAGTYDVTASKTGYNSQTQSGKTVTAGQTTTVNFTITRQTGTISGNVKNSSGQNLSGATVTTNTGGYSATTDANGNYTISNVATGTYDVTASKSGYNSQTQTGKTVNYNQTTTVNFTLTPSGGSFSGVANGNFEGGFFNDPDVDHQTGNSWHRFVISGVSKSGGDYGVYRSSHWSQTIYESNWTAGIYQQATGATVGSTYTASVYVRGADSNVKFWVGIDPYGGTNPASANVQWSAQCTPGTTWTQISKQVTAQSSTITMFVKAQNTITSNRNAWIDDASLSAP